MYVTKKIENFTKYPFQNHFPILHQYQFLVRANRMNCNYTENNFSNQLSEDYPFFSVHIVFSGCSYLRVKGKEYLLKAGDAFIVCGGTKHEYGNYNNSNLGYMWIELSKQGCQELLTHFQINDIHVVDSLYTEKMTEKLSDILFYVQNNKKLNFFDLSALEYSFLSSLFEASLVKTQKTAPSIIHSALQYIDNHFTETMQIQDLANSLNVSHSYLTRQFTKHLGMPPVQYLLMRKIAYASQLLLSTDLSCAEISEKTGFYDSTHFNRTFRKIMHITPLKYAKYKLD
ncbi:MAG: AraC family transcriptional regulator [Clostridia bacterium]